MTEIVKIGLKELKILLHDPGTVMLFMIAIIIYPILYSLAYDSELVKDVPIAIVDENKSDLSRKLAQMIDASDEVQVLYKLHDFHSAEELFDEGKIYGIIHIPEDFNKKILRFESAHISVYADASYMVIYKQVLTAANYSIGTMSAGIEIQRRMAKGQAFEVAYRERDPLPLETYSLYNPHGGYSTYAMPAVLLLILQQTLLLGIGLLGGTTKEKGIPNFIVQIGLKRGDILLEVNGRILKNDADAWDLYKNADKFDEFEIKIKRNNQIKVLYYEVD
jgi:ABC-2 type transport system permease protein